VKERGKPNDLVQRIESDPFFAQIQSKLKSLLNPSDFVGRAPEQVDSFLQNTVRPALRAYDDQAPIQVTLRV
jgi:adenylosuccinate lyase